MEYVGLDFETYASTDLKRHGLYRYTHCSDFTPLLAAVAYPSGDGDLFDFIEDYEHEADRLVQALDGKMIVAHNAGFEQAVLASMGIELPSNRFIDSAVLARAAGAAGKLEAAGPQLLGIDKLEVGHELIKLFCIPGKYQEHSSRFDPQIRADNLDLWSKFAEYCAVDAELSLQIAQAYPVSDHELAYNAITMDMNNVGWHVDLPVVRLMQVQYEANIKREVDDFRLLTRSPDLNLNSTPQLIEWCANRGVRATSFDEAHVEKLMKTLNRKLIAGVTDDVTRAAYLDVRQLLWTKQVMGGSSLKKLATILDTVGADGRLHDQYLHIGAGATYRTTGRGVQMQNLKRLNGEGDDMAELYEVMWDNGKLAANLRQVFTATDPLGQLVVGDFSSVESRGLAWQAGENWKLRAYASGEDLYKVQAAAMFGLADTGSVTKDQRQIGKVAELACGYGAGPDAVKDFAAKMGVSLSEAESTTLVKDWRAANPWIVGYWQRLDEALHTAVEKGVTASVNLPYGYVRIAAVAAPQSLRDQVKSSSLLSLQVALYLEDGTPVLKRVIHGVHLRGRNIGYWKPSELKNGDLWRDTFTNPKTKQRQAYTVYGGKLSGLLTQSLCREVFFHSLRDVHTWCAQHTNVRLVGQFHDEIVLDWDPVPGGVSLIKTRMVLAGAMTCTILPAFPLAADIKFDYRYIK